ncbi:MAG TPA: hypothetical protein VM573_02615 [Actinomycetota bacterium]|jgi:hypothetical protein|nr:hypothetical protein [Actinomycetota bacterium]
MRVSIAVCRSDPPEVWVAREGATLARVLAVSLVANTRPEQIGDPHAVETLRRALLDERWDDAVRAWIEHTGIPVDVYDDVDIVDEHALDEDHTAFEIRMAPLFGDPEREAPPLRPVDAGDRRAG